MAFEIEYGAEPLGEAALYGEYDAQPNTPDADTGAAYFSDLAAERAQAAPLALARADDEENLRIRTQRAGEYLASKEVSAHRVPLRGAVAAALALGAVAWPAITAMSSQQAEVAPQARVDTRPAPQPAKLDLAHDALVYDLTQKNRKRTRDTLDGVIPAHLATR